MLTLGKKLSTLVSKISDDKQFMHHVAFLDAPGVQRLVKVALKNRKSPAEIVRRIEKASEGLYHVKSFEVRSVERGSDLTDSDNQLK